MPCQPNPPIVHRWWLVREDFGVYVESCRGFYGELTAAIDWPAVWAALEDGHLPCSSGERQVLRVAASIAEGVPIDLRDAVTSLASRRSSMTEQPTRSTGQDAASSYRATGGAQEIPLSGVPVTTLPRASTSE